MAIRPLPSGLARRGGPRSPMVLLWWTRHRSHLHGHYQLKPHTQTAEERSIEEATTPHLPRVRCGRNYCSSYSWRTIVQVRTKTLPIPPIFHIQAGSLDLLLAHPSSRILKGERVRWT